MARYAKLFSSLRKSPCHEVVIKANIAARDIRTTTGRNVRFWTSAELGAHTKLNNL